MCDVLPFSPSATLVSCDEVAPRGRKWVKVRTRWRIADTYIDAATSLQIKEIETYVEDPARGLPRIKAQIEAHYGRQHQRTDAT